MKWIKALVLVSALAMMPMFALADDDRGDDIGDDDDFTTPAVPEPSGALVMGVALASVALLTRRLGK
jgi:hypothetical protein